MTPKSRVKNFLLRLDRFSPRPAHYPFEMSRNEQEVFDEEVGRASHYVEFGLGGSTLRALQKSRAIIHSVESDPQWISKMERYLLFRLHKGRRLRIHPVDIGPVGAWGFPTSAQPLESFADYSANVFGSIDCDQVNLALIDGRFRVACTLKTILECRANPGLRIMIHDFWDRPQYHQVLAYLETVKAVETMGIFVVKTGIDMPSLQADYETYKFIPA